MIKRSRWWGLDVSDRARARIQFEGRTPNGHPIWTKDEDQIVHDLFPDYAAMKKRLRRRSPSALKNRAGNLGLTRRKRRWTPREVSMLRQRWPEATKTELIAEFPTRSWSGLRSKAAELHLKRSRKLKITGKRLLDEIRQRALRLNLSLKDLDRICLSKKYFAQSRYRSARPRQNVLLRAIAALGGRVEIVWR